MVGLYGLNIHIILLVIIFLHISLNNRAKKNPIKELPITFYPENVFMLFTSAAYVEMHFRLLLIMEATLISVLSVKSLKAPITQKLSALSSVEMFCYDKQ